MLQLPPQHTIDARGAWVFRKDKAIDQARVEHDLAMMENRQAAILNERAELQERADGEKDAERKRVLERELATLDVKHDALARKHHPWMRYLAGATRYDLDAQDMLLGQSVTARDYLTGEPTVFVLRRMSPSKRRRLSSRWLRARKAAETDYEPILSVSVELCKHVEKVEDGGALESFSWASGLTEDQVDQLSELDDTLLVDLAAAVLQFSIGLTGAEKKR